MRIIGKNRKVDGMALLRLVFHLYPDHFPVNESTWRRPPQHGDGEVVCWFQVPRNSFGRPPEPQNNMSCRRLQKENHHLVIQPGLLLENAAFSSMIFPLKPALVGHVSYQCLITKGYPPKPRVCLQGLLQTQG